MNADLAREMVFEGRRLRGPLTHAEAVADLLTWCGYVSRGREPAEGDADLLRRMCLRWGWANGRGSMLTKARKVLGEVRAAAWRGDE